MDHEASNSSKKPDTAQDGGIKCFECLSEYTVPKFLPCGHLLCRPCVIKRLGTKDQHYCPSCGHAIVVLGEDHKQLTQDACERIADALATDVPTAALVQSTQLLRRARVCVACRTREKATMLCVRCGDMLCPDCNLVHEKLTASQNHKVVPIDTLNPRVLSAHLLSSLQSPILKQRLRCASPNPPQPDHAEETPASAAASE